MFTGKEIIKNLQGCLEVALLMPQARKRFSDDQKSALRSFIIPLLFFPVTLLAVYLYPANAIAGQSANVIFLLYSLRLTATWALFLGAVYLIVREVDRKQYFYQFVTAVNWLTIPSMALLAPVAWLVISGAYTPQEIYPFASCLIAYSYFFTAFMASYVLRVPWELAGFITMVSMVVNNSTLDVVHWVGSVL